MSQHITTAGRDRADGSDAGRARPSATTGLADDGTGTVHLIVGSEAARLVMTGEIDQSTNADLTDAVNEAISLARPVQVDVRHVQFMDSSGIATLAYLAQRTQSPLTVIQPPDVIRFLMEVTRLDEVVDITEDDPGFPSRS